MTTTMEYNGLDFKTALKDKKTIEIYLKPKYTDDSVIIGNDTKPVTEKSKEHVIERTRKLVRETDSPKFAYLVTLHVGSRPGHYLTVQNEKFELKKYDSDVAPFGEWPYPYTERYFIFRQPGRNKRTYESLECRGHYLSFDGTGLGVTSFEGIPHDSATFEPSRPQRNVLQAIFGVLNLPFQALHTYWFK